jgi:hypothetical protein
MELTTVVKPEYGDGASLFASRFTTWMENSEGQTQAVQDRLEASFDALVGSGVIADSYAGDLISIGSGLSVDIAAFSALIGYGIVMAAGNIGGLEPSDTNSLYLFQDGSFDSNVTDINPGTADNPAIKLGEAITDATTVTTVDNTRTEIDLGAGGGGSGTVTSVALTLPSWLTATGSPITTSGTLAVSAATGQTENRFLATPDGVPGAVDLRAIGLSDLPLMTIPKGGTGVPSFTPASLVGTDALSTTGPLRPITLDPSLTLTGNILSVTPGGGETDTFDDVVGRDNETALTILVGGIGVNEASPETLVHITGTGTEITTGLLDTNLRLQTDTATASAGNEISFRGHSSAAENVGVYAALSAPVTANSGVGATGSIIIATKASQAATGLTTRAVFDSAGVTIPTGKVIAPNGQLTGLLSKAVLGTDASGNIIESTSAGTGTVTSVALTLPSWLSVAGSPITASGTLAVTAATGQTANRVIASPDGSSGAVSLRALVNDDLPTVGVPKGGTGATSFTAAALVGTHASTTTGAMRPITLGTGLSIVSSVLTLTEADTLDTVSDRSATTPNTLNVGGLVSTGNVTAESEFIIADGDTDVQLNEIIGSLKWTTLDASTITNRTVASIDAVAEGTFAGVDQAGTSLSIKLHQNPGVAIEVFRLYASGTVELPAATAKTVQMARQTTANTQGTNLTIAASSATVLATNKAGGTLDLRSGIATGNAGGAVTVSTPTPGSSGTGDRAFAVRGTFDHNGLTLAAGTVIAPAVRLTGLLSAGVLATDGSGNIILSSVTGAAPSWDATLVASNTTDEKAVMTRNLANAASDYTFALTGTPDLGSTQTNSQSSALLRLGNALSGASNRGTYFGINMPSGTSSDFFTIQQNGATKLTFTNGAGLVLPVDSGIFAIGAGSGGAGPTGTNVNGNMVILDTPSGLTRNWIDLQKNHVSAGYWADDGTAWVKSLIFGTAANHTLNNSGLNLAAGTMIAPAARLTGLTSKTVLGTDSSGNIIESSVSGESWIGEIKMWSPQPGQSVDGTSGSPSADWAVCDGRTVNSITTPDLENLFILGATVLGANLTGGSSTHVHSIDPPNTSSAVSGATTAIDIGGGGPVVTRQISEHDHDVDIAAFDSASAGHTPPYYSLVYVMKVA